MTASLATAPTTVIPPLELSLVRQPDLVPRLTRREREVLALMAEGLDNAAICRTLWISAKTLERHVQNVFTKLELPRDCSRHRRVCAVLAWLRSPVSHASLAAASTWATRPTATAGPVTPR